MSILEGKTAIITGGARGLGAAICEIFAREGADIAFNYHSNDACAAETVERVQAHGRRALAFKVSVADRPAVSAMVQNIREAFGRIDILVNNAAINPGELFVTTSQESWDQVMDVNINGVFNVTHPTYRCMMKQRSGSILNLSSISAIRSLPTSVHYATSKSAIIGFTKCLAREAAPFGITVNAIAAGIFDTDLASALPNRLLQIHETWCSKGRRGRPAELAEFAAFLVSGKNSYMTGEVITLDGGTVT
jgi:3-oxoacyl-[acyl-carrier protein] reductase